MAVAIETRKSGQRVLAYDKADGAVVMSTVTAVFRHEAGQLDTSRWPMVALYGSRQTHLLPRTQLSAGFRAISRRSRTAAYILLSLGTGRAFAAARRRCCGNLCSAARDADRLQH